MMNTTTINKSFHNTCILNDILLLNAVEGDKFIDENPDKLTTDECGNITHIIGRKVITPKNATYYELEGYDSFTKRENLRNYLLNS
jgi:hypothetical protein